ncbi:MAG TPA: hypothetical protein PLL30_08390 [Candidatus Krumholzibacteria bacterium]|nr:hypothetical protein [Candidatus Krumholzibacteria bacterium]HPD71776.1 hypothetical protein [Candidatus Krumholzibacteria bacterium]HRY41291.1 hypothetical protein [Candidatus Krumholzibacteria bacterium]
MARFATYLIAAAAAIIAIGAAVAQEPHPGGPMMPPPPPPRSIPGITTPDQFPRGCVDCHVDRPDLQMDVRLSTLMRQWQQGVSAEMLERVRVFSPASLTLAGRHPEVEMPFGRVPDDCLECHGRDSTSAPPFATLLHGLHLAGSESNHFVAMFQGECTHCHKLDASSGSWSLGSGAEREDLQELSAER